MTPFARRLLLTMAAMLVATVALLLRGLVRDTPESAVAPALALDEGPPARTAEVPAPGAPSRAPASPAIVAPVALEEPPAPAPPSPAPTTVPAPGAAETIGKTEKSAGPDYQIEYYPGGSRATIKDPSESVVSFDPKVWTMLRTERRRLAYLTIAPPVRACAVAFMDRHGYESWVFGGIARLRAQVAEEVLRFESLQLFETRIGHPDRPPDEQFLDCYQRAVASMRLRCPGCRAGSFEFTWRLLGGDYFRHDGPTGGDSSAVADPAFFVEQARQN